MGWVSGHPRSLVAVPGQYLSELVESIIVDAYGSDEQLTAFLTVFDEEVDLPCAAQILDIDVEIVAFDLEGDERRGLVVRGRRIGGPTDVVSLADVRFESGTVAGWLHAAFRSWLGLKSFPPRPPEGWGLAGGLNP
jgi:hypothetical protein